VVGLVVGVDVGDTVGPTVGADDSTHSFDDNGT
jgi:hypothetical protein